MSGKQQEGGSIVIAAASAHPGGNPPLAGWVQEIVPFGIFTTDGELRVTTWNEWLVSHSGLPVEAMIGRPLLEIFPSLEERRLHERYAHALKGEVSVLSSALHRHLLPFVSTVPESGLPHMLQTARIAPLSEQKKITGTITIIEDVTQREFQAGILLRQQELDRLLSSSLAALLQSNDPTAEMPGIFATISPALGLDAYASYLLSPDGKSLRLDAAGGIAPKQRETIGVLSVSEPERRELREADDGRPTALGARQAAALGSIGLRGQCFFPLLVGERLIGCVSFASYHREEIPPADAAVLARISRYVAIAIDRARRERETTQASRAKDDFLAALSHELRTPLNPVLLVASDAATNMDYPAEAREAFHAIEKNVMLEARLIDDLLDLTRIEHGKLGLEVQAVDVHTVLKDALETVRMDLVEHGHALEVKLGADAPLVVADSARLQQVFWNVIKNAIKFTPAPGIITVKTSRNAEGGIVILVTDSGIGMDASEVGRVFGAFAQGDHAERGHSHRFGGLGLGLAISRKLIELHGGSIEASSPGKNLGATFTITLPPAMNPAAKTAPGQIAPGETLEGAKGTSHKKPASVLVVEDHEPTRLTLVRLLRERGYDVVPVSSSTAALHEASRHPFDLVLSDIGLPDGDGFSLMRRLRERHALKGISLSGFGMGDDLSRSSAAGFCAHLTKPVSVNMLDRALESAFARAD